MNLQSVGEFYTCMLFVILCIQRVAVGLISICCLWFSVFKELRWVLYLHVLCNSVCLQVCGEFYICMLFVILRAYSVAVSFTFTCSLWFYFFKELWWFNIYTLFVIVCAYRVAVGIIFWCCLWFCVLQSCGFYLYLHFLWCLICTCVYKELRSV